MAEAAAAAAVHESVPENQKELKDSDTAAAAQKLMQISGEEDENNNSHEKKMAKKREKTPDSKKKKKKMVKREKVPDFVNHQNQSEVTLMEISEEEDNFGPKRQKYRSLADIYKATEPVSALKSVAENQKELIDSDRAATDQKLMQIRGEDDHKKKVAMKREKTKDSKKKKQKMVKREKVPDFANHENQSEVTSMEISEEEEEEEENFGPKRQKYRSLADIYKATEPGVYYHNISSEKQP